MGDKMFEIILAILAVAVAAYFSLIQPNGGIYIGG